MITDVTAVSNSFNKVNTGHDSNQDSWMTMWCNTNWGDLLQPAPLSIALLGSVCVIATSTDDFALTVARVENDPNPPIEWTYVRSPDSFKTCLQQMVGDGYDAYETAFKSMTTIQNRASIMPQQIQQAVQIVFSGTSAEVSAYVPDLIDGVLESSEECRKAAMGVEAAFEHMCGLAQELVIACTHKAGNTEQILNVNKVRAEVLQQQAAGQKEVLKQREETAQMMKDSFKRADDDFHDAVKQIPSGWDLVGMQAVESIVGLAVSAGNAAISAYTLKAQVATAGLDAFKTKTGSANTNVTTPAPGPTSNPQGVTTLPNSQSLTDPAILETPKTLALANALNMLLVGGKDGQPDWEKIRSTDPTSQSGGNYIKYSLEEQKKRLDPSKPYSQALSPHIDTGLTLVNDTIAVAGSADAGSPTALSKYDDPAKQLVTNLQSLNTACSLLLQQPGAPSTGMATPQAPPTSSTSTSAAKLAVDNAKYKADITRANLDTARKSYESASKDLVESQKEVTETLAEITKVSLENATLENMLPILKKAVATFTLLRAQFSKITEFFVNVSSLVSDVLKPSVDSWAKALDNTINKLAGVSFSSVTKQFIYTQMMVPLKVCTLSEKVASTYLSVSNKYIMPAQRRVGASPKEREEYIVMQSHNPT